jgi:hypothetical protein
MLALPKNGEVQKYKCLQKNLFKNLKDAMITYSPGAAKFNIG